MNRLDQLLQQTSRTFALSIPMLPEKLQHSVTIAYLLFRIADTIEDELIGPMDERANALRFLADEFEKSPSSLANALSMAGAPAACLGHEGYSNLVDSAPFVINAMLSLDEQTQCIIAQHLSRTARGMADFLGRDLTDANISDLSHYCYIVAGIVGEMLTTLFLEDSQSVPNDHQSLFADAALFGEGLQLVNIIRDSATDRHMGRRYLPRSLDCGTLLNLARKDLDIATRYVRTLDTIGVDIGIIRFNTTNVLLALETLGAVSEHGPGAKITRAIVGQRYEQVCAAGSADVLLSMISSTRQQSEIYTR